jgi:hypothetical protein
MEQRQRSDVSRQFVTLVALEARVVDGVEAPGDVRQRTEGRPVLKPSRTYKPPPGRVNQP